jgi:hypothetical protein
MGWGLLPILAQTLVLQVSDRAELRAVAERADDSWDTRYEAEDSATLSTAVVSQNSAIGAQYNPTIIVTPLEGPEEERQVAVFHRVGAGAAITWRTSRRTTLVASQTASYELSNTRLQGLSDAASLAPDQGPIPPEDEPGAEPPPTANADIRTSTDDIQTGSLRSQLSLDHRLSRIETLGAFAGYGFTAGLGDSRTEFPLIHGPDGGVSYARRVSRVDTLTTLANARYAFEEDGDRAFLASLGEEWAHKFTANSTLGVGAGVTYVYTDPVDAPAQHDFFFGTGSGVQVSYTLREKVNGGILTLNFGASYAPVIDQRSFTPDVRFGVFAGADWTKDRLTLYARTNTVLSAEPDDAGSLNSVAGALGSIYDLGAGFAFEGGARAGWQTFGGQEVLPASTAVFVALSWAAELNTR